MIELIKHSLGLCGEGHITIFHIIGMIGAPFVIFKNYIKFWLQVLKSKFNRKNG